MLNFYCRGIPKAQPRPRARVMYVKGKPQVHIYDELRGYDEKDDGTKVRKDWDAAKWRERIIARTKAEAVGLKEPIKGPIRVDIDFNFPRPGYMLTNRYPIGRIWYDQDKNDRDNLDKLVLDAITQAGWYIDSASKVEVKRPLVWYGDGQVCAGEIQRWYCGREDAPGARIIITRLVDPEPSLLETVK